MAEFIKKIIVLILVAGALSASFSYGIWFGKQQVVCKFCQPQDIDFSLFWEAYHKLQEKFVDPEKFDTQKIIYSAISGMVQSLGDPYTVFFPPQETKKFMEDVTGVFEGVGMEIGMKKGQLQVISPIEGTPAQKAGIRAGDKILKIDDVFTADITIDKAVDLIRGKKGTQVTLTILRQGWDETKEIKITREVISVPSLKLQFLTLNGEPAGNEGEIAHIQLYHFSGKAGSDFREAAIQILNSSAKKIILDLRGNPGGYLEISQEIAGWFLKRVQVVVIEDFGAKGERQEYKTNGNGALSDYPLVVLINAGSASASEILAGALHDNRGVLLIGEKSFGKGSVQELENLTDGSSLKITVAKWLTPKGKLITDVGLEPDIKVELTDEDYENNRDPQMDKAVEIVKNL